MSHYQLFRQSANEFVKVLWGRDGEIRELRAYREIAGSPRHGRRR